VLDVMLIDGGKLVMKFSQWKKGFGAMTGRVHAADMDAKDDASWPHVHRTSNTSTYLWCWQLRMGDPAARCQAPAEAWVQP